MRTTRFAVVTFACLVLMPHRVAHAQNDGCQLNYVPAFCDPGANGPGPEDNCGCDWLETFDTYPNNTTLVRGTNFWYGWADNDAARGFITDEIPDHTTGTGKSMRGLFDATPDPDIQTDAVHWFLGRDTVTSDGDPADGTLALGDGAGYDVDVSDYWILEAWVFLPTDHTGESSLIVNSWYTRGDLFPPNAPTQWHIEYHMDSGTGRVWDQMVGAPPASPFLPLVKGEWVKLEARINLDAAADNVVLFYDGQFLVAHSWTGVVQGGTPQMLMIGNLDLFVSTGTATYFDDLSVVAAEPGEDVWAPSLRCVAVERDPTTGCSEFLWSVTNRNFSSAIEEFYLDIAAGSGARYGTGTCVGQASATDAVEPPPGWTVTNCTRWNSGHALFRFTGGPPIAPNASVQGGLRIDANKSVSVNDQTAGPACNGGAGIDVPPFTVLVSAAQILGNEIPATCAVGDYSFGPCFTAPGPTDQNWSTLTTRCVSFLNAPSTSGWAKVVLATLLVVGGGILVRRSHPIALVSL